MHRFHRRSHFSNFVLNPANGLINIGKNRDECAMALGYNFGESFRVN
jgi:hypothetical protein